MRLNQYVAHSSGLSRRAADAAITAGRVMVDGTVASLGMTVQPTAVVELDGKRLTAPHYQAILLHKPVGYVTSRRQQGSAPTIYELLPTALHALKPAGRLDRDSSGLLVLTNDGALAQILQHPSRGKWKRYEVALNRPLTETDRAQLERGVTLEDGSSQLEVKPLGKRTLVVRLQEGRNRQIRRSFAALDYRVVRLHRTDLGSIGLGKLAPGKWQPLEIPAEMTA
ncbi:MAG TPA: pseudouridine synthase [Candidatus Saccharimonadales bacterium]|nr:pseudouridine synthase [Candidatus Saccharimonadales bacterium]